MAAEQSQDGKANIKVEKQPNGHVRIVIEGLSIAGNMMDVEEGVLQYLNQAGTADLDVKDKTCPRTPLSFVLSS